jgi:hypothetical protein
MTTKELFTYWDHIYIADRKKFLVISMVALAVAVVAFIKSGFSDRCALGLIGFGFGALIISGSYFVTTYRRFRKKATMEAHQEAWQEAKAEFIKRWHDESPESFRKALQEEGIIRAGYVGEVVGRDKLPIYFAAVEMKEKGSATWDPFQEDEHHLLDLEGPSTYYGFKDQLIRKAPPGAST